MAGIVDELYRGSSFVFIINVRTALRQRMVETAFDKMAGLADHSVEASGYGRRF
jgi:hypothetical protein